MKTYTSVDDLPVTMSVEDVSSMLGISRMAAYNLCRRPDFPAMRIGKRILIPKERFLCWMDSQMGGEKS